MRERHSSHGAPDGGPARAPSLLIAGAATWDLFAEERRPGGPIVYGARAAAALGVRAQLLTIAGPDSDFEALRGHDATIVQASHTLSFVHTFSREAPGPRELRLLARPERALSASDLPPSRAGGDALDLLLLAPLLADDLDLASFAGVRRGGAPCSRRACSAMSALTASSLTRPRRRLCCSTLSMDGPASSSPRTRSRTGTRTPSPRSPARPSASSSHAAHAAPRCCEAARGSIPPHTPPWPSIRPAAAMCFRSRS